MSSTFFKVSKPHSIKNALILNLIISYAFCAFVPVDILFLNRPRGVSLTMRLIIKIAHLYYSWISRKPKLKFTAIIDAELNFFPVFEPMHLEFLILL